MTCVPRLSGEGGPSGYDSGYSGRDSEASSGTANPDLQASVPVILQHLEAGRSTQQQLLSLWAHKKARLDQCFQLRLFEQDCDKVRLHCSTRAPQSHTRDSFVYSHLYCNIVALKIIIKFIESR